jgi:hypothetical protein
VIVSALITTVAGKIDAARAFDMVSAIEKKGALWVAAAQQGLQSARSERLHPKKRQREHPRIFTEQYSCNLDSFF